MDDPRVDTVVDGRYRVDRRLAAGGTGVVYVGTQLGLDRAVAIKFLHKSSAQSRTRAGRFEREARVMSQLSHPNVAQVIDFGFDEGGSRYLVMELCKGVSLRELLAEGPLELRRGLQITRQILTGLTHAHHQGIVHRDLKPGNVLVGDSLGQDHVKILDFGVAKIMSTQGPTELSVAAGRPLGTPHYMSPEQATSQSVDARSDIYALGVMMYEMTTGERPFDAGVGFALLRQHVEDVARPPGKLREMSPQLERVIVRAMEKDPDDRFQTAAEMLEALSEVPEAARPGANGGRRAAILLAFMLVLGGAAGAGWYGLDHGWFDRWRDSGHTQAQLAATDAAVRAPLLDAAPRKVTRPSAPTWSPPAATVVIPPARPFPAIDNQSLKGKLAGKTFRPRFALVRDDGSEVRLELTDAVPTTRLCADLKLGSLAGPRLSLTLPELPEQNVRVRSSGLARVLLTADESQKRLAARWELRFSKLDADAQIAVGELRIRGRKAKLRGNFIAAYCARRSVDDIPRPTVNGVAWAPASAPAPRELPHQAVAGVFAGREFVPRHINLTASETRAQSTLSFFAKAPDDPCQRLVAGETGAAITLPATFSQRPATLALLSDTPAEAEESALFQVAPACPQASATCPQVVEQRASILSLRVDDAFTGELRGRLYLAAPGTRPSLLVGAFRARDCRARSGERAAAIPADAGAASDARNADARAADASTADASSTDAGARDSDAGGGDDR